MNETNETGDTQELTKPGEGMKKLGGQMVVLCLLSLAACRSVVAGFFPELQGQGLTKEALLILIPIWSVGIGGLLLLLMGWLLGKVM
jgi:hypothetical protein